jgi:hypothetical protein
MNREVQGLRDSAHKAQKPHGDYVLRGIEEFGTQGGVKGRNRLTAVVAWAAPGSSKLFGLVWSSPEPHRFCGRWTGSKSSQVVRISLEDAISRKAIGSPD